jgi:hypothetical protein
MHRAAAPGRFQDRDRQAGLAELSWSTPFDEWQFAVEMLINADDKG